jgi:hypothetical protein
VVHLDHCVRIEIGWYGLKYDPNLQTAKYGFAAVSSDPSPLPITNVAAQNPPNERYRRHGHASRAPSPYRNRPQMKQALYP